MIEWLRSLSLLETVYLYLAAPATLILLIQTALTIIGLAGGGADFEADAGGDLETDVDIDADTDIDADADGMDSGHDSDVHDGHEAHAHAANDGLRVFTIRGFVAFFSIFGWAGLFFSALDAPVWLGLLLAQVFGAAAMLSLSLIWRAMKKLTSSGTLDLSNAIGKEASVYLTIPADPKESGKVMLVIQERLVELEAVTDCGFDIPTGSLVTVSGTVDEDTLLVRPCGSPQ